MICRKTSDIGVRVERICNFRTGRNYRERGKKTNANYRSTIITNFFEGTRRTEQRRDGVCFIASNSAHAPAHFYEVGTLSLHNQQLQATKETHVDAARQQGTPRHSRRSRLTTSPMHAAQCRRSRPLRRACVPRRGGIGVAAPGLLRVAVRLVRLRRGGCAPRRCRLFYCVAFLYGVF